MKLTQEILTEFHRFAAAKLSHTTEVEWTDCLQQFQEIWELKQAMQEIRMLPEAAAGCGYSREEILAQYEDRLQRLTAR